ncbi:Eukaryotic translation initiation factor 2 subunit gamma [Fonsecaea nubica]|uniref:Eukaryotic translation initiation factor 2 subunit gamma n=1 Tax=Fonsecaea nubica TaxID=856822 RepID=A0A178CP72_9EURO|nr:Eukaryotic translation initiation factor 2 subunit gamma [Fonsecaea nubica]OAL31094.1 Eukaryotic translation initiation factor 2 subunit gamma [Fonsecaea nubica]
MGGVMVQDRDLNTGLILIRDWFSGDGESRHNLEHLQFKQAAVTTSRRRIAQHCYIVLLVLYVKPNDRRTSKAVAGSDAQGWTGVGVKNSGKIMVCCYSPGHNERISYL